MDMDTRTQAHADQAEPPGPALQALCEQVGLATRYHDFWGTERVVDAGALRDLLAAMGLQAADEDQARAAADALRQRQAGRCMEPVIVARQSQMAAGVSVAVRLPAGQRADECLWSLEGEGGERHGGLLADTPVDHDGLHRITLPASLRLGYHRLVLQQGRSGGGAVLATSLVILCPDRCWEPPRLKDGERLWGPCIQLYALRSGRNWGIGDFSDLKRLLEIVATQGAGFVGLNPLHALFAHEPERASPYSPSSRNGLNALYIDVEAVADYAECAEAAERVHAPDFQQRLAALRDKEFVDYDGVAAAKHEVLRLLYAHFRRRHLEADTRRGRAFRQFQQMRGPDLRAQALFDALQAHFHAQDRHIWGWSLWPQAFRDPKSREVADFAREHEAEVEFFEYLQWQAELQLHAAHARAESLGMAIGLYRDLAVGVNEGGAETWQHQSLYALGVHVGAPPEEYNLTGQDWGLPPQIPERMREQAYGSYIETLRTNMRHAGALRLDHVMALMRLYWVPPGRGAKAGAYMSYPLEDLLGIMALESHRHRCLIIGEDLGTVPPRMREAMREWGILSYCPLFFERGEGGSFKRPAQWHPHALAVVSTHDLPTLRGFWRGDDVDLRHQLHLFPTEEQRDQQVVSRALDRAQLLLALEHEGLQPEGTSVHPPSMHDTTPAFTNSVYRYLARTPAQLVGVQLEDVTQQIIQVNVPGTREDQFPNWRRKLNTPLELLAADPRLLGLAESICAERPPAQAAVAAVAAGTLPPLSTADIPRATYRVQLHAGFRFDAARELVPYLDALGVSHLYTSPNLRARQGSTHGYDIIDHHALNPEIGDEAAFEALCNALRSHGMRQLLDIVPNHMGVLQADNAWWLDVLENGPASVYADTFDIEWQPPAPELAGKVLLPVLGDQYGAVLESGELQLAFDAEAGEFFVRYYDHRFPIDPVDYPAVFAAAPAPAALAATPDRHDDWVQLQSLIDALGRLPARDSADAHARAIRHRDRSIHKRRLARWHAQHAELGAWIAACLNAFNGVRGRPESFDALDALLQRQAYRLAFWRVAGDDVNYRRFFDVSTLAAVRMDRESVFDATHHTIFRWLQDGSIAGLRIDHPDGLNDPAAYFTRLQQRHVQMRQLDLLGEWSGQAAADDDTPGAGQPQALYLVIEKILAEHERLPADWPVHGGVGYRFANLVNGLFVDGRNEQRFDELYAGFIGERRVFEDVLYASKHEIIRLSLAADLQILTEALYRIAQGDRRTCDFTRNRLRAALTEMAAGFPVYRTYISERGVSDDDRQHIAWAWSAARRRMRAAEVSVLDFLRDVLLHAPEQPDAQRRRAMLEFASRWQQFTAPVMAKSMEDTAFYRYLRLTSLNDVGGDPRHFGLSVAAFHAANQQRCRFTPHALLGSSTHDSKRSEDVRTRIDVLSEIPDQWAAAIERWSELNRKRATRVDGELAPSRNDEYLFYQTLFGVWPLSTPTPDELDALRQRVQAYMLKAVREAKERTSWINPHQEYEQALARFIDAALGTLEPNPFLTDFRAFTEPLQVFGCINSLNLVAIKLTSPGVPDVYQGCEGWNFSLVDPDNRRPVDYGVRRRQLAALQAGWTADGLSAQALDELCEHMADGRLKLLITWRLLALRRCLPQLFEQGGYHALPVQGAARDHVIAFARSSGADACITVGSRLLRTLTDGADHSVCQAGPWGDTAVCLAGTPAASGEGAWRCWITGQRVELGRDESGQPLVPVSAALTGLPAAVLVPESVWQRTGGGAPRADRLAAIDADAAARAPAAGGAGGQLGESLL